jgi:hypothetical protein
MRVVVRRNRRGRLLRPGRRTFIFSARPVRAENLNPDVLVMRPADEGVGHDASDLLNRA